LTQPESLIIWFLKLCPCLLEVLTQEYILDPDDDDDDDYDDYDDYDDDGSGRDEDDASLA